MDCKKSLLALPVAHGHSCREVFASGCRASRRDYFGHKTSHHDLCDGFVSIPNLPLPALRLL